MRTGNKLLRWVAIVWLVACCAAPSRAVCGDTEQDRLVYARERMYPGADEAQLRDVYQWLVNGTRSCPTSYDLAYYRALVAKRLGETADAQQFFAKAHGHSAAEAAHFDPFEVRPAAAPGAAKKSGERYALLVGVGEMEYSDDFLEFASRDAEALGKLLVSSAGFKQQNVTVLVGQQAKTQDIREAFGKIRVQAKEDDLVLVYFSSHGSPRKLDPTGLSYVYTYDTNVKDQAKVFSTALQMVELAELGRWVKARDYVLLLDTCFSGAARAGEGSNGLEPLAGLAGSGSRVVVSASSADEHSFEDEATHHGYFTQSLLEAIGGPQQAQSVKDVYDYVQQHVSAAVAKTDGRQQHPVMQTFGGGEKIVIAGRALAAGWKPDSGLPLAENAGTD